MMAVAAMVPLKILHSFFEAELEKRAMPAPTSADAASAMPRATYSEYSLLLRAGRECTKYSTLYVLYEYDLQ